MTSYRLPEGIALPDLSMHHHGDVVVDGVEFPGRRHAVTMRGSIQADKAQSAPHMSVLHNHDETGRACRYPCDETWTHLC
jgi:hypothetical protein